MSEDTPIGRAYRLRAIGGGRRADHVLECLTCGALVTQDWESMTRHRNWHAAPATSIATPTDTTGGTPRPARRQPWPPCPRCGAANGGAGTPGHYRCTAATTPAATSEAALSTQATTAATSEETLP